MQKLQFHVSLNILQVCLHFWLNMADIDLWQSVFNSIKQIGIIHLYLQQTSLKLK